MAERNVSAIISGAGFAASFWTSLDKTVRAKGGTDEDIYRLGMPEGEMLIDQFASLIVGPRSTVAPPSSGRIHVLSVPVDEARPWEEAVRAANPTVPSHDMAILWVGDQYPSQPVSPAPQPAREIVLVNFGNPFPIPTRMAIVGWGERYRLRPATPRIILAVAEQYPNLNRDLEVVNMNLVSLLVGHFLDENVVCAVVWLESERWIGLKAIIFDDWNSVNWFPFTREESVL